MGKLISNLFNLRQKGDYGDFMLLTEDEIVPLISEVEKFIVIIKKMIQD